MEELKPGYYRHFKDVVSPITRGNPSGKGYYYLIGVASHSETLEAMVVYRALYGERKLWVRPATMWNEIVDKQVGDREYHGPRFVAVEEQDVLENVRIGEKSGA